MKGNCRSLHFGRDDKPLLRMLVRYRSGAKAQTFFWRLFGTTSSRALSQGRSKLCGAPHSRALSQGRLKLCGAPLVILTVTKAALSGFLCIRVRESLGHRGVVMNRSFRIARTVLSFGIALLTCGVAIAQDVKYNSMPARIFQNTTPTSGSASRVVRTLTRSWTQKSSRPSMGSWLPKASLRLMMKRPTSTSVTRSQSIRKSSGMLTEWAVVGAAAWPARQQSTISIGSLVLDMYEPGTKELVWTGTATKTIDPSSNQEKNQKNLDKAMAKLLKNYPPKK